MADLYKPCSQTILASPNNEKNWPPCGASSFGLPRRQNLANRLQTHYAIYQRRMSMFRTDIWIKCLAIVWRLWLIRTAIVSAPQIFSALSCGLLCLLNDFTLLNPKNFRKGEKYFVITRIFPTHYSNLTSTQKS